MATGNGMYLQTMAYILGNGFTASFDYDANTIKGALVKTAITTNFNDTTPTYADVSTQPTLQPADSGDYVAGGVALTTKSISVGGNASGRLDIIGTCPAWTGATLSAEGLVVYDDTPTTPVADPLLCQLDFGGTVASTSGTYTVTLNPTTGYIQMDLTP